MKRLAFLAFLGVLGCSAPEQAPEGAPPPAAKPATKEEQMGQLRQQIASKRAESLRADAELADVTAEREKLAAQPASEAKTNRLAQLAKVESDTKQKKEALNAEIATLEQQLQALSGPPKPKSGDESLDAVLAAEEAKQKEEAERKRQREEAERDAEKRKLAEAERARQAELAAREKEKLQAGQARAGGPDDALFEDRWGDVILRIKAELQKYKKH
jgi:colicin import membrane protein